MYKRTKLARALILAFGAAALVAGVHSTVLAQTSATGNIFGDVASPSGMTLAVELVATGARRTITPDASGRFQATALTPGMYRVQLMRGNTVLQTKEVEVLIGQGSEINFASAEVVQKIEIVSRRQTIDVSTANTGVTFTAAELQKLPVAPNVGAVIQLAPTTVRGDTRYGGASAPSFSGASAAENAYHINGFPVTNVLYMVGFSQLPFGSISQTQILAGGYGAEFGRSTGGVVNITTKSGTNDYEAGAAFTIEPKGLRNKEKNQIYPNNGRTSDGRVFFSNEDNRIEYVTANAYISGPIIKDKLFFYYNAEEKNGRLDVIRQSGANAPGFLATGIGTATAGFQERRSEQARSLLKLDWNITQDHHLEYTNVHDKYMETRKFFGYNYGTLERNNIQRGGIYYVNSGPTPVQAAQGADFEVIKYTGYLTENLTFTALTGWSKSPHIQLPAGYNPNLFVVEVPNPAPGINYIFPQSTTGTLLTPGAGDTTKAYRFDLEWKLPVEMAGRHTLRGGVDNNVLKSVAGNSRAGGGIWRYSQTTPGSSPWAGTGVNAPNTVAGNALAQAGFYVERDLFSAVSTPTVKQSAKYIEDRWQVTKDVLLTLGLRAETFDNLNGDQQSYIKKKDQIAPRLAAAWDVSGNSSFKAYSTWGRYHLPLPTNVAVRGAGSSLFTHEFFAYTGVDPVTGAPTGLTALNTAGPVSANGEFGQAVDPRTVAAKGIKSHFQDEFTIGFEKALTRDYNLGAKLVFRDLKSTIDDFCDERLTGVGGCWLFNPGQQNTLTIDVNGDGILDTVVIPAGAYPKPKRKYTALEFFLEHPLRDRWYGRVNYTLSRARGNTEGLLLSDIGQADVATTQVFDYPEITVRSDGPLPSDRTHLIKAYGFYELTPEWGVGLNVLAASGRPKNCLGLWPDQTSPAFAYGPAFFSCNGVPTSRGSEGRLPWDVRFDLSLSYRPEWLKGLQFKANVYNLFNRQVVETIEERRHVGTSTAVRAEYGAPLAFTAPRYMSFTAQYDHKF